MSDNLKREIDRLGSLDEPSFVRYGNGEFAILMPDEPHKLICRMDNLYTEVVPAVTTMPRYVHATNTTPASLQTTLRLFFYPCCTSNAELNMSETASCSSD